MIEIRMPELSASTTEATVVAWIKQVGDRVRVGDLIAEVETDKSTVEIEANEDGVLDEILVEAGTEDVAVGTVLARMRTVDVDDAVDARDPVAPAAGPAEAAACAAGPDSPQSAEAPASIPERATSAGATEAARASATTAPSVATAASPFAATPLARRMAAQANLDLATLSGSGRDGRITQRDVVRALDGDASRESRVALHAVPPLAEEIPARPAITDDGSHTPSRTERLGAARRTAAQRLSESKRTAPHFYLDIECDAERLLALRSELNEGRDGDEVPRLTVNDLLVRIAAVALSRVPEANVSWHDGALRVYERVDLAVAVASERGLVTPVVRDAARKSAGAIALELRDLVGRAQQGRLRPEEYAGGTVTLSNLGMYGVRRLFPILNLPQACILGVGAMDPSVVARDGVPVVRRTAVVTLAADHRAVDGAVGARLLAAIRSGIENPLSMLL